MSIITRKGPLELFKFAVYLAVPISLTAWVINGKASFESVRQGKRYVEYPEATTSFKEIETALKTRKK